MPSHPAWLQSKESVSWLGWGRLKCSNKVKWREQQAESVFLAPPLPPIPNLPQAAPFPSAAAPAPRATEALGTRGRRSEPGQRWRRGWRCPPPQQQAACLERQGKRGQRQVCKPSGTMSCKAMPAPCTTTQLLGLGPAHPHFAAPARGSHRPRTICCSSAPFPAGAAQKLPLSFPASPSAPSKGEAGEENGLPLAQLAAQQTSFPFALFPQPSFPSPQLFCFPTCWLFQPVSLSLRQGPPKNYLKTLVKSKVDGFFLQKLKTNRKASCLGTWSYYWSYY